MPVQWTPEEGLQPKILTGLAQISVEGKYIADSLYPVQRIANKKFIDISPFAVTNTLAPVRQEKAEPEVAVLPPYSTVELEAPEYALKDLVTMEASRWLMRNVMKDRIGLMSNSVMLSVEKATIDEITKSGCQTGASTQPWDAASGQDPLLDINTGRETLQELGIFPNALVLCPHDLSSLLLYLKGAGFLADQIMAEVGMTEKAISRLLPDLKIYVESNKYDTTALLDDMAIIMQIDPDFGCLYEAAGLAVDQWVDEDRRGWWIRVSRTVLPVRRFADAVYVVTNTKS